MKSYRINVKAIIAIVVILSLIIFSLFLISFRVAETESIGEMLLHYGFIIAPITLLWALTENYLWHTRLFQSIRKSLNIPPDLRGRWEGTLENADGSPSQKFVIEVKQSLTTLVVHSFSSIGYSEGLLCEIAASHNEEVFTLCYLWEGGISASIKDIHSDHFAGYTMLKLNENAAPKTLRGSYFTNRTALQTRGGIELKWISKTLKSKLE
ncbi:MAG TPA: hypothetical protein VMY77_07515 [Chitinophagaceae bacterium]|nr:hypothetical protein [Chitinophagaceae bacterium]